MKSRSRAQQYRACHHRPEKVLFEKRAQTTQTCNRADLVDSVLADDDVVVGLAELLDLLSLLGEDGREAFLESGWLQCQSKPSQWR